MPTQAHGHEPRYVADPGPPTWQEVIDGFMEARRLAARQIQVTAEALGDFPRPLTEDDVIPARVATFSLYSAAMAVWSHWQNKLRWAEAFVAVHPDHMHVRIDVECIHKNACRVSDDAGHYREPPKRQRAEVGDDDDS